MTDVVPDLARRGCLRPVPRDWLADDSRVVAERLLGTVLVRPDLDGTRVELRVVETEAYDQSDPASHTHRGRTPGNATMFGPPGHALSLIHISEPTRPY